VQKKLWNNGKGIDPFMSSDIFIYAPMRDVHTNKAIEHVLEQLEKFTSKNRSKSEIIKELRRLGKDAQQGFPDLS